MEILVAIIGILVGIGGILGGMLKSSLEKNKQLEKDIDNANCVNNINEKITSTIMENKVEKKSVAKKNGFLFSFLLFMLFTLYGCAGKQYYPIAPNLVKIEYKTEEVAYYYNEELDLFCLNQQNIDNLDYNIRILYDVIKKYEGQIILYNEWKKQ